MINTINKKMLNVIFLILFFSLINIQIVLAVEWQYGSTHQHTGYSTWWGYDGSKFTENWK